MERRQPTPLDTLLGCFTTRRERETQQRIESDYARWVRERKALSERDRTPGKAPQRKKPVGYDY